MDVTELGPTYRDVAVEFATYPGAGWERESDPDRALLRWERGAWSGKRPNTLGWDSWTPIAEVELHRGLLLAVHPQGLALVMAFPHRSLLLVDLRCLRVAHEPPPEPRQPG